MNNNDLDENDNLPKEKVLEHIIKEKQCGFNCWICYFNAFGARDNNHQISDRKLDCTLVDLEDYTASTKDGTRIIFNDTDRIRRKLADSKNSKVQPKL